MRPSFQEIYMRLAIDLAKRSTCKRKQVGCVIVSEDYSYVYGIGYNGNAKGENFANTCDSTIPGSCGCLHSEDNALLKTSVGPEIGKIVFVTMSPCTYCAKRFINKGGVKKVYYHEEYRLRDGLDVLDKAGIPYERI